MRKSEVNNKHKDKYGKLKDILSFWYFKRNIFQYGISMKQNPESVHMEVQYTRYPSTARGSSLAFNDRTLDVRVMSDRPSTP